MIIRETTKSGMNQLSNQLYLKNNARKHALKNDSLPVLSQQQDLRRRNKISW